MNEKLEYVLTAPAPRGRFAPLGADPEEGIGEETEDYEELKDAKYDVPGLKPA